MNQPNIDWIKTLGNVTRIVVWILVWYNVLNGSYDVAMVYTLIIMALALTDIVDRMDEKNE